MEDLMTSEESNREYLNSIIPARSAPCPYCGKPLDYLEGRSNGDVHKACHREAYGDLS